MSKIFVSIASLEDPALTQTIKNCLSMAKYPENISFGISLQYDTPPDLSFINNKTKIISFTPDIDSPEAPGIIEIRSAIRKLVEDEDYFLQIDAHTRFENFWDEKLVNDLENLRGLNPKTIISSQLWHERDVDRYTQLRIYPSYDYKTDSKTIASHGELVEDPDLLIIKDKLIGDLPYFINNYMSGNFYFAHSSYLRNMEFPDYHKFPLEEAELSLVTFCNGYTIAAPLKDHVRLFADNDTKYSDKDNPRWWLNNWEEPVRKWVSDDREMLNELEKLMLTGKNRYMSIYNVERFYVSTNSYEEYKACVNELIP